jgi:hypothetical protein
MNNIPEGKESEKLHTYARRVETVKMRVMAVMS